MTLPEIKSYQKDYLIPSQIAPVLGCGAYYINLQVKEDKKTGENHFPFPTILIGSRVKIPRIPFLKAMGVYDEISK